MADVVDLLLKNFLSYAEYVIKDRAIPSIEDGLKPVQRRILHTLQTMDDGKLHKVANVVGETMKYHPHGDASIVDALVSLTNRGYFIEGQGNFGNTLTGHPAAAARYIECRLTPLAKDVLFSQAAVKYTASYDGRRAEPLTLPSKIPTLLLLGNEGIAVGMATKTLPHNFSEVVAAIIAEIKGAPVKLLPDFFQGGLMDPSGYHDGVGKVKVRAKIEVINDKRLRITEIPFGTTTESLIASIDGAAKKGKVKIAAIEDFTTDSVNIELALARGEHASSVIPKLFKYTECEVGTSTNPIVLINGVPEEVTTSRILQESAKNLIEIFKTELEAEKAQLEKKLRGLRQEQVFFENQIFLKIMAATSRESANCILAQQFELVGEQDLSPTNEEAGKLLDTKIVRLAAFDRDLLAKAVSETILHLKETSGKLEDLPGTSVAFLKTILKKYGKQYPRKTKVSSFEAVKLKKGGSHVHKS